MILPFVSLLIALSLFASPAIERLDAPVAAPEKIEVPFELRGGLVFVQVKVNGKAANFILDSGAPMMVLSSRLATNATDTLEGKGISGSMQMQRVVIPHFEFGAMRQQKVQAIALDLTHLEKLTKRKIDGLIGYTTLKDYELLLDYKNKNLVLFKPNATAYHRDIKPKAAMPFVLQAHMPVVEAKIGTQILHFGLDTGAEANLLDLKSQRRLQAKDYRKGKTGNVAGANQGHTAVQEAYVNSTLVNGHSYTNMHYVFSDISHMNQGYGLSIDGLLGYPFLSARKISVNYADEKVYFWD